MQSQGEKRGGATGWEQKHPPTCPNCFSICFAVAINQTGWKHNWKHTFKVSTRSISFNQTALAVTDCRTRPRPRLACLSISAYCATHVKLYKVSIILFFPLQETADNYINSLQLMIIIIKCDCRRKGRIVPAGISCVWIRVRGQGVLMKRDQLAVERGLPIIHVLQVSKRGSGTLLKHKRSRCEAPWNASHCLPRAECWQIGL